MNLNLRNRISLYYLLLSSALILFIFLVIYGVVYFTVYNHLDRDLDLEALEMQHNLVILNNTFFIGNHFEWGENEHKQIEVNPMFIQITDVNGNVLKKTSNLLRDSLNFNPSSIKRAYFNNRFSSSYIRQLQQPIISPSGKTLGYIIMAIPLEESEIVLKNLSYVLAFAFLFVIVILFFATRLIAGKSISPIGNIIGTAERITKKNLAERITVPVHHDELYRLAITINELLDRLEDTLLREKQFTSDASHELRTPLAVIRGTLEVLIRKPRTVKEYHEKILFCLSEVDRMNRIVEQLLLLARFDTGNSAPVPERVNISVLFDKIIPRFSADISSRNILITKCMDDSVFLITDHSLLEIMLTNILSNAVKYSGNNPEITISVTEREGKVDIIIEDNGFGLTDEQKKRLFDPFYRGSDLRKDIPGVGLGLSIVKKLSGLLYAEISIDSEEQKGTRFIVTFAKSI